MDVPVYVTDPSDRKTNWRPQAVSPYESLWSLLHKFAYLNALGADHLQHLFAAPEWAHAPGQVYLDQRDLRTHRGLRADALTRFLRLSEQQLREATVAAFAGPFAHWTGDLGFSASRLRFCPSCLKDGFHSALFQILGVSRCPDHLMPLAEACPACGQSIRYALTPESFCTPYGCGCGESLWPGLGRSLWPQAGRRSRTTAVQSAVELLSRLETTPWFQEALAAGPAWNRAYRGRPLSEPRHDRWASDYLRCWTEALGEASPPWVSHEVAIELRWHGRGATNDRWDVNHVGSRPLRVEWRSFKAVARRLRRIGRTHATCYQALRFLLAWAPADPRGLCPYAVALVQWEVFWRDLPGVAELRDSSRKALAAARMADWAQGIGHAPTPALTVSDCDRRWLRATTFAELACASFRQILDAATTRPLENGWWRLDDKDFLPPYCLVVLHEGAIGLLIWRESLTSVHDDATPRSDACRRTRVLARAAWVHRFEEVPAVSSRRG